MNSERRYTLKLSCPDRVGIVARVAGFFAEPVMGPFLMEQMLGQAKHVGAEIVNRAVVDGVEASAYGYAGTSGPEPATLLGLLVAGAAAAGARRRRRRS